MSAANPPNPHPGALIVIEGIDGAGTTTQTEMLSQWLQRTGVPSLATREPSDGPIGVVVRQHLGRHVELGSPEAEALAPYPTPPRSVQVRFHVIWPDSESDRIAKSNSSVLPPIQLRLVPAAVSVTARGSWIVPPSDSLAVKLHVPSTDYSVTG